MVFCLHPPTICKEGDGKWITWNNIFSRANRFGDAKWLGMGLEEEYIQGEHTRITHMMFERCLTQDFYETAYIIKKLNKQILEEIYKLGISP